MTRNRLFPDGQVDQPRHNTQSDSDQPHHVVTARTVIQITAQPYPQKGADLVAEKYESAEHGQMLNTKNLRHQRVGGRHR